MRSIYRLAVGRSLLGATVSEGMDALSFYVLFLSNLNLSSDVLNQNKFHLTCGETFVNAKMLQFFYHDCSAEDAAKSFEL